MKGHSSLDWRGKSEESIARWTFGLFAVFGLVWIIGMLAWSFLHQGPVEAASTGPDSALAAADGPEARYETDLRFDCPDHPIVEGDDFLITAHRAGPWSFVKPRIRGFWYTIPMSAGPEDYEHLYAAEQTANNHQNWNDEMGRNFHTTGDQWAELTEQFKVWFNNTDDHGDDGECIITLLDHNYEGIHKLEIVSEPTRLGHRGSAYVAGDEIRIRAHFTGPVTTLNKDTGSRADYAAINVVVGDQVRYADMVGGDGTKTITFSYTVQPEDWDADGISIQRGDPNVWPRTGFHYHNGDFDYGLWSATQRQARKISPWFRGMDDNPNHSVVGRVRP